MPAISLLGTDYTTLDAWWDAEKDNDYSGAGPILEVPAGLGAMLTGDHQFRYGSASKYTIRAVSGDEVNGDVSTPASIAALDCGGWDLDFRNDDIIFENIYLHNVTETKSTGDSYNNLKFDSCVVDVALYFAGTATGLSFPNSVLIISPSTASGETEIALELRSAVQVDIAGATLINKAGGTGTSNGVIRNASTAVSTFNQVCVFSPTNKSYTDSAAGTPTGANNADHDGLMPGTGNISTVTAADFVDYAAGNYQLKSESAPALMATPAGAFVQPVVNVDPALDSNIPDLSVIAGNTGSYDTSAHFSDSNAGDTLTYSVSPALPSGLSLNTSTGVISWNGSQVETASANHTVTADDGNGGAPASDVISVTITPAVPLINSIDTDNDIQAGQTAVTIACSNLDAAPTIQTVTLGGEALSVTNWNNGSPVVDIPLHIDLEWGQAYTLSVTDDTQTVTLANVTLSGPSGWSSVTFTGAPAGTSDSFYEEAQTDAEVGNLTMIAGDILVFEDATGLTVDGQTIPTIDPAATVTGGYKIWDVSAGSYTGLSTYTWTDGGVVSDIIAPDFVTGPGTSSVGQTSFNVDFTPDEGGSYRIVVLADGATAPTDDEVLAGTGSGGAAVIFATALLSMSESVAVSPQMAGLTIGTDYDVYIALIDAQNNKRLSSVINQATGTENTAPVVTAPANITIEFANGEAGLLKTDAQLEAWVALATVTDDADSVTVDADLSGLPSTITAGIYNIQFDSTADGAGLTGSDTAVLTVAEAAAQVAKVGIISGVTNSAGALITQVYDRWAVVAVNVNDSFFNEEVAPLIDSGTVLQLVGGAVQVSLINAVVGQSYTLVASTNDETHNIREAFTVAEA